jgi:inosose dehydratase
MKLGRREFSKTLALGVGAAWADAWPAAPPRPTPTPARKIKIGYTCITWGTFPRGPEASATLEPALKDIAGLGFHSFETFPEVLEDWEAKDGLTTLLERYGVPLGSGYIRIDLADPAARKENLQRIIRSAKVVKKYGGTFGVFGPGGVKRDGFDFKAALPSIVSTLNEAAMALADVGIGAGLHPHTGTPVETRDEVYAVLEAVDARYMKFAPDVGQLQKGGMDAAKVVKDFLPMVRHVHLKDWDGGPQFGGYCPLGQGRVDLAAVVDSIEGSDQTVTAMVELDPSRDALLSPLEAATVTKAYLQKLGYTFRG